MTGPDRSVFRRRITVTASQDAVHAGLEDDFHHYELLLRHADGRVLSTDVTSFRTPWTTCVEAGSHLSVLVGHSIGTRPTGLPDPHHQCTHMFELAVVALGQATRLGSRRYDVAVPHREIGGSTRATLHRDGTALLDWDLSGDIIAGPAPFVGRNLRTILNWASTSCDDDTLEAIRVLRRGVHVSTGRSVPFDSYASAAVLKQVIGACYVFQPERAALALRNPGTRRDFTSTPALPLATFESSMENRSS